MEDVAAGNTQLRDKLTDLRGIIAGWALIVLSILSSTFFFALDNTIVADVQPVIVIHFDLAGKLTGLSVPFLIGAASTNLIWGKMYCT